MTELKTQYNYITGIIVVYVVEHNVVVLSLMVLEIISNLTKYSRFGGLNWEY